MVGFDCSYNSILKYKIILAMCAHFESGQVYNMHFIFMLSAQ